MNKPSDRVIRAIIAGGSLTVLVAIGYPMFKRGHQLSAENQMFVELEKESSVTRVRNARLQRIESTLQAQKDQLIRQNVTPPKIGAVRDEVILIIRKNQGSLRSLEIQDGQRRAWAERNDDPHNRDILEFGSESDFELHSHAMTLAVTGKLASILKIVETLTDHHWLMSVETMDLKPIGGSSSDVIVELNITLFGLELTPEPSEETFAFMN